MSTFDDILWGKISELQLDESHGTLPFSKRLARENKWSPEYTDKVVNEYKKFIYLVATEKVELTPSDQVDQAWHLHLAYTCSYWHKLCRSILGFELHHLPTKGGLTEQERFKVQYQETLRQYRAAFCQEPDPDVWPSIEERFENVENFIRINNANAWVIPKPSINTIRLLVVTSVPLYVAACTEGINNLDLWFWTKIAIGAYIIYRILKWVIKLDGKGGSSGGSCGGCAGCGGCGG